MRGGYIHYLSKNNAKDKKKTCNKKLQEYTWANPTVHVFLEFFLVVSLNV